MLTKEQTKRLAKEARKLAMECVEGRAPNFGNYFEFSEDGSPCCANGHVAARSGFAYDRCGFNPLYDALPDRESRAAWFTVGCVNDHERAGLPWALLSFADVLEESARK